MLSAQPSLEGLESPAGTGSSRFANVTELATKAGLFPRQQIRTMILRKMIQS
jgi:hypothetical protein